MIDGKDIKEWNKEIKDLMLIFKAEYNCPSDLKNIVGLAIKSLEFYEKFCAEQNAKIDRLECHIREARKESEYLRQVFLRQNNNVNRKLEIFKDILAEARKNKLQTRAMLGINPMTNTMNQDWEKINDSEQKKIEEWKDMDSHDIGLEYDED